MMKSGGCRLKGMEVILPFPFGRNDPFQDYPNASAMTGFVVIDPKTGSSRWIFVPSLAKPVISVTPNQPLGGGMRLRDVAAPAPPPPEPQPPERKCATSFGDLVLTAAELLELSGKRALRAIGSTAGYLGLVSSLLAGRQSENLVASGVHGMAFALGLVMTGIGIAAAGTILFPVAVIAGVAAGLGMDYIATRIETGDPSPLNLVRECK